MITMEDFASAMPTAESLLDRLDDLYGRLPETRCTCDQLGMCCSSNPFYYHPFCLKKSSFGRFSMEEKSRKNLITGQIARQPWR